MQLRIHTVLLIHSASLVLSAKRSRATTTSTVQAGSLVDRFSKHVASSGILLFLETGPNWTTQKLRIGVSISLALQLLSRDTLVDLYLGTVRIAYTTERSFELVDYH